MASSTDANQPFSWRLSVPAPAGTTDAVDDGTAAPQEHFLCSSDPALIQLDALHRAMDSDLLWWAMPLEPHRLATMVANSVCLGMYRVSTSDGGGGGGTRTGNEEGREMVGFARLITDTVTFAYLTDVYVLPAYQRRGLGAWMMRCLREFIEGSGVSGASNPSSPGWPDLRSLWLVASTPAAARMYMAALGAEGVARYRPTPGEPESGMILVEMPGPANGIKHHATKNKAATTATTE